jgi:hypothetical protein
LSSADIVTYVTRAVHSGSFKDMLTTGGGAVAAFAARGAISAYSGWRQRKATATATKEDEFRAAVASDDIDKLGDYLRNDLGQLKLDAYVGEPAVQRRVDQYIQRLAHLLNQPSPDAIDEDVGPSVANEVGGSQGEIAINFANDPETAHNQSTELIFLQAYGELSQGKIWNALASVRRHIETLLRTRYPKDHPARILRPTTIRSKQGRVALASFLSIANRAIHGDQVTEDQARRALAAATFIVKRFDEEGFLYPPVDGRLPVAG